MNDMILKRIGALMSVKSLVTLVLTGVFAYMACTDQISQDFMTIYAVIIAFYFGTQSQKVQDAVDKAGGETCGSGSSCSPAMSATYPGGPSSPGG